MSKKIKSFSLSAELASRIDQVSEELQVNSSKFVEGVMRKQLGMDITGRKFNDYLSRDVRPSPSDTVSIDITTPKEIKVLDDQASQKHIQDDVSKPRRERTATYNRGF